MPKFPKPFFRAARQAWFVQVRGKQINLGPDREAALSRYHELMRQTRVSGSPVATENVLDLRDAFLDWCQKHKAARMYVRLVPR